MPHTFNAARRDKIAKQKYQVTNWPAYNESLRQRGDLTIWVKDEALSLWTARRRTSRGGQPKYSDLAITLCLTLRVVYGLALRQTQGLMRSVAALMGFDIAVPDFSTLSRV
ncbi:transposase (plasmid) [Rhizobium sp. T1470]|uniref:transposase n=1 Tax=Rhizobium sp. T1470 TaxID=555320 RepID=UPI0031013E14